MKRLLLALCLLLPAISPALPTYVGIGAVTQTNTNTTATVACPAPVAHDVQFIWEIWRGASSVVTPSGFTAAETSSTTARRWYYRILVTGSETNPTIATGTTTAMQAQCLTFRGLDNTTPVLNVPTPATNSSQTLLPYPAVTPSINNEVLLYGGRFNNPWTSVATLPNSTEVADSSFGNTGFAIDYWIQTTATSVSAGTVAITGGSGVATNDGIYLELNPAVTAPTYSVAPAVGTRTTSSVPITQTSACTDCTAYGVEVTSGSGAPTCTQIKAGQNSSGSAAFKSASVALTANTQGTLTFSSITDGTVKDGYFCLNSTTNNDSSVSTIANIYKLPAFSAGPSFSSVSTGGATYSLTLDGAGTAYGVACIAGSTAPTITQVEAGQCTGGATAQASANKAVTGADSLIVGTSLTLPMYDFYFAGTYGSQHEASAHAFTSQMLTAPSGKQYIQLTSISSTSFCNDLNATISPTIAVNDIYETDLAVSPGNYALTVTADCNENYIDDGSGARQKEVYSIYDYSAGAFMSGSPANHWFNDPPITTPPTGSLLFVVPLNSAMTPVDLSTICTSPAGDAITVSAVDALPAGLSISGNTLSGTATAQGIYHNLLWKCTSNVTGNSAQFH